MGETPSVKPHLPTEVAFAQECALRVMRRAVGELEAFFVEDGISPESERYMARVSGVAVVLACTLGNLIGTKVPNEKNLHETVANATLLVHQAATERWEKSKQLRAAAGGAGGG